MKKSLMIYVPLLVIAVSVASCRRDAQIINSPAAVDNVSASAYAAKPIEALCEDYFKAHPAEKGKEKIISVTNEFMAINKSAGEFNTKKPCHIQPIYAYGIDGVAYYEVWFTENGKTVQGWILISATDKDYPLVNFSQGIPYSSRMINDATRNNKIYRFGASYYAMEKDGQKVAEYGKMPSYIVNTLHENGDGGSGDSRNPEGFKKATAEAREGVDYINVSGYEELKSLFPKYYYSTKRMNTAQRMQDRIFPSEGHGEAVRQAKVAEYQYRWVGGTQCYYTQIPANTSSNNTACWSGCNNNAWANIFGWWDRNRAKANLIPTTSTGETSPIYRNTAARRLVTDPVQMYCRAVCNTYCGDGTGWTLWSDGWKGYQYAPAKGYGYVYQYQWCNSTGCNVALANIVTDAIANNYTPAHIGANSHFYVGYGWAQWTTNTDWTWAYCYPGWSENNNDDVWISWHDFNTATKLIVY